MDKQWIFAQLEELFSKSCYYKQKGFLLGLKELVIEQEKRKEILQEKIDGELWSPRK